jgi:hypothetical protein
MEFPIQAVGGPRGSVFVGCRSSEADTEVRPPAGFLVGPVGAGFGMGVQRWLGRSLALPRRWCVGPAGAGFGGMPSGADTEVRPPAGRLVGPVDAGLGMGVQQWLGRSLALPRRWCVGPAGAGFGGMPSGADTEVRPPATLVLLGVSVGWIERCAPSSALRAPSPLTGEKDTIQAGARGGDWEWAAVYGSDGASPSRGAGLWARPALVSEGCPAVRTQRSALPRRWCC